MTTLALPYPPDIAVVLDWFRAERARILGGQMRGMYLDGSLALGDFDPRRSDIDFVVVTDAEVSDAHLTALQALHARFNASDSPWATEVEAGYIPRAALRRYDPTNAAHPHIERGADRTLDREHLDSDWVIHRFVLREHSIALVGPDPRTLIDPVSPAELRRAVVTLMLHWWGPMRGDPRPLEQHAIGYQVYAVLTMCRVLYTLETGAVASKPVAARWVQAHTGTQWHALIERALAWRKDAPQTLPPGDGDTTRDLIASTLERVRQWEAPSLPPISAGHSHAPERH